MPQTESPIEELFYQYAKDILKGLEIQYQIGPYRVDFALPDNKLAIEIDGKEYHDEHQKIYTINHANGLLKLLAGQ